MDNAPHDYALTLSCERTYLAGFPLIVAVDLHNVSHNALDLVPFFDLFTVPGPVSFVLRGGDHERTWPKTSRQSEGEPEGVEFGPGRVWHALQDLSNLHPDIPPGHYELSARMVISGEQVVAEPVRIEILPSTKEDRAIASRLRATNDEGVSSWRAFIKENWSTPDTTGLSAAARAQLAFYLYLHRVTYGPQRVAALDSEEPGRIGHGVLEGDVAAIRLEILRAAGKPEAAGIEAAILERWPGLAWWVDQIHKNSGLLMGLRTSYGAESSYASKDKPQPYAKGK
jgi:hypothetical protein